MDEILRSYDFGPNEKEKIPLSKEMAYFEFLDSDVSPTPTTVAEAQRLTGEAMWLAQKTRPDISFAACLMASITLKAPSRCLEVGFKVLRYLQGTKDFRMSVSDDGSGLVLYPDAAFAPSSGRSHTGWLVCWSGAPVAWRSGRQAAITLSTAESELQAIIDGTIGMLGLEAMLLDLGYEPQPKMVASDSTSALAIGAGTGSWRTRHLRLKAAWIQERIAKGEILTRHQPGIHQPADLLTKALPGQRICDLLQLWGLQPRGQQKVKVCATSPSSATTRMLVALVCCLMMMVVESRPTSTSGSLELDWDMMGMFMGLLMILGGLVLYETAKWGAIQFYREWTPGASARKLRRLQKLREATTLAIERELEKRTTSMATTPSRTSPTRPTPAITEEPTDVASVQPPRTPRRRITTTPSSSPGELDGWSITDSYPSGDGEDVRVLNDMIAIMRVEDIRVGLRELGLPTSGVKVDVTNRLATAMSGSLRSTTSPTLRQCRYILWLWRHKDLSGRALLTWECIRTRVEISRTIHRWKSL